MSRSTSMEFDDELAEYCKIRGLPSTASLVSVCVDDDGKLFAAHRPRTPGDQLQAETDAAKRRCTMVSPDTDTDSSQASPAPRLQYPRTSAISAGPSRLSSLPAQQQASPHGDATQLMPPPRSPPQPRSYAGAVVSPRPSNNDSAVAGPFSGPHPPQPTTADVNTPRYPPHSG